MNKSQLVNALVEKTSLSKKDTETTLNALMELIPEVIANGDKIQLIGFGTFDKKFRAEREGRNPKTKETIKIPSKTVPVFIAGSKFKEIVNK